MSEDIEIRDVTADAMRSLVFGKENKRGEVLDSCLSAILSAANKNARETSLCIAPGYVRYVVSELEARGFDAEVLSSSDGVLLVSWL